MTAIDGISLKVFLNDRNDGQKHHSGRLVVQKNQLKYVYKIGIWTGFKAKFFNRGPAAMGKVRDFVEANRETLFSSVDDKNAFNTFITVTYNPRRTFNFKRVRTISTLASEGMHKSVTPSANTKSKSHISSSSSSSVPLPKISSSSSSSGSSFIPAKPEPVQPAKPNAPIDPAAYGDSAKVLSQVFAECQSQYVALNSKSSEKAVRGLADQLAILALCVGGWEMSSKVNKAQYKKDKQLLNDILNFKNEVRAACLDKGEKALKGNYASGTKLLKKNDQELLRAPLKDVRTSVLKKYFSARLEMDGKKLANLQARFLENQGKGVFTDEDSLFLDSQLKRYQRKLDSGKPIAFPKWFHCTKTDDTLKKILDTYILYMHKGMFPGSFVANLPELDIYGNYCIVLSDHIEKTATRNPGDKNKKLVLPTPTKMDGKFEGKITFSDVSIAPEDNDYKNHQAGVGIWLGFQRGAATLNPLTKWGTDGIPLKCKERVNTHKPLSYYKDTTVAGVVFREDKFASTMEKNANAKAFSNIANAARVQHMKFDEEEALRALVNATFVCTLPKAWDGKL